MGSSAGISTPIHSTPVGRSVATASIAVPPFEASAEMRRRKPLLDELARKSQADHTTMQQPTTVDGGAIAMPYESSESGHLASRPAKVRKESPRSLRAPAPAPAPASGAINGSKEVETASLEEQEGQGEARIV